MHQRPTPGPGWPEALLQVHLPQHLHWWNPEPGSTAIWTPSHELPYRAYGHWLPSRRRWVWCPSIHSSDVVCPWCAHAGDRLRPQLALVYLVTVWHAGPRLWRPAKRLWPTLRDQHQAVGLTTTWWRLERAGVEWLLHADTAADPLPPPVDQALELLLPALVGDLAVSQAALPSWR